MKEIKGKVVSYSEMPTNLIPEWLTQHKPGSYVEVHIDSLDDSSELDLWFKKNYPGIEEETFYIEIDY